MTCRHTHGPRSWISLANKKPLPSHPVSFGIEESAQIDKQLGTGNEPKMESQKKIFVDWRNTPRVT